MTQGKDVKTRMEQGEKMRIKGETHIAVPKTKCLLVFWCGLALVTLCSILVYNQLYFTRYLSTETLPIYANFKAKFTTKIKTALINKANLSWLDENPIYTKYKIPTAQPLKKVTIIVVVTSAPSRGDRRQAIRETYWTECKQMNSVVPECIFITDRLEPNQRYYKETQNEVKKYGDLKFQHLTGGVKLGERVLVHMLYALKNYDFDYILRADDDYFICLSNVLQELPMPVKQYFHWGWCHQYRNILRPDEAINIYSKDVIEAFLKQDKNKMKCHVSGDQMVAIWAMEMNYSNFFRHDGRLHHTPLVATQPHLLNLQNVCSKYMGLHGSYPKEMRTLYSHRGPFVKRTKTLLDNTAVMNTAQYGAFNWRLFIKEWNYEPKLCITNPTWDTPLLTGKNGEYKGRNEKKDR